MLVIQIVMLVTVLVILSLIVFDEHIQKRSSQDKGRLENFWFKEERRQSPRLNINLDVVYKIPNKIDQSDNSKSNNISKSGIQLLLKEKFEKDTILSLEFEIPDNSKKKIFATGQVVWMKENQPLREDGIRTFNAGIRFIQIDEEDEKILADFVSKNIT
ncbi:MAG: PilZ domain-containing protein [Candidatus Omnitrophica bacterium]|nr:PilZ domain-containing protein [Candidatus Omnitrophota bacterium]